MNAFFRFLFPHPEIFSGPPEPTLEEIKQRDTVLTLLGRTGTASSLSVDPCQDVTIHWDGVILFLFRNRAMVTVHSRQGSTTFDVPYKNCPEAKAAREDLYLKGMSDVCEKALRATEPT